MWLIKFFFLNSANLICRTTDISKYFRESLGVRDNESRLYSNQFTLLVIPPPYHRRKRPRWAGGGWGRGLNFVCYIGWTPASCVYPQQIYDMYISQTKKRKKNSGISAIPKKCLQILAYPKNIRLAFFL